MSPSPKAAAKDAPARRPGRPRSAEADQAILGATLALLVENGFAGLTMEAVAARSGTSKATVYRRWPSKVELVVDALKTLSNVPFELEDSGSAREEYLTLTEQAFTTADPRLAILMPRLMAEAAEHPKLYEAVMDNMVTPRRDLLTESLRRGVERGELREDLDVDLAVDLLIGPLIYRVLLAGGDLTHVRAMRSTVWDAVMAGVGPRR